MHKKGLKVAPVEELAKLNFSYTTVLKYPKLSMGLMIGLSALPSRQILVVLALVYSKRVNVHIYISVTPKNPRCHKITTKHCSFITHYVRYSSVIMLIIPD